MKKRKDATVNQVGICLILLIIILGACFLLCFAELIPLAQSILNTSILILLLFSLVLTGIFISKLWKWLRPRKTLAATRWIVIISGLLTYAGVLYITGVTLIIMALSDYYMSKVDCPQYNVSLYLYDSSFMFGNVTVKVQRGNSIFLEKVSSYSTEDPRSASLFHKENYVSVRIKDKPQIIYLDLPPIKK